MSMNIFHIVYCDYNNHICISVAQSDVSGTSDSGEEQARWNKGQKMIYKVTQKFSLPNQHRITKCQK